MTQFPNVLNKQENNVQDEMLVQRFVDDQMAMMNEFEAEYDDSDEEDSEEENSDESDSDEVNFIFLTFLHFYSCITYT